MVEQAEDRVHRRGSSAVTYFCRAGARRVEEDAGLIERQLNRDAVNGEDAVDERGLALDGVGVAFQHGSERQEPEARAAEKETDFKKRTRTSPTAGSAIQKKRKKATTRTTRRAGIGSVPRDPVRSCPRTHPTNLWFELSANTGRLHLHARATAPSRSARASRRTTAPRRRACAALPKKGR